MALEPNWLTRRVQFALELVDPFTGGIVYRGMQVEAKAADGRPTGDEPVVNKSGRFVWLERDQPRRPAIASIAYRPGRLPFAKGEITLAGGPPAGKLVSERLTPSHAYNVPLGVTAIRGRLIEKSGVEAKPIAGACVQIAWATIRPLRWIPPFPKSGADLRGGEVLTDGDGQFLVFVRLPTPRTRFSEYVGDEQPDGKALGDPTVELDVLRGWVRARLQFTRFDTGDQRFTPFKFKFLPEISDEDRTRLGRIPEGRLLPRELQLDWNEL
ncbi:hypothetical protein OIU34_07475 [Pararhizobium sp. BT-229]|uniref:hypothetical protein n=1 Tax=Pararhizobium sp. BT-229 TaxID=2986923 RepID=UPI0021F7DCC9|nr:hypothetical protein [Pararhizobium sp. BT-229]MCV9961741.1 hypothetical protein [Pararhizobium sp. BT-229]